jgi:hypothetical protein
MILKRDNKNLEKKQKTTEFGKDADLIISFTLDRD